ncbi:MAG: MFS transporter [Thermoplasmata archaeon]|jgi:MFS family permease|nr:MFS transporter [Euryarchaeota archaeon]MVT36235.1 MFS transporter [Euryarchaeota archaeon]
MLSKIHKNTLDLISIILSRSIYAFNWYNISPLLLMISISLGIQLSILGLVPAFFLLGAGIFQIPAGLVSAKIGPKKTAMAGMYILSIFTILSGFSWNLYSILFFRFMIGAGAAFYFSPAIGILKNLFSEGRRGFSMGIYNAAFNLGAGLSVAITGIIANVVGWRWALILSGVIGLAITIENHLTLPDNKQERVMNYSIVLLNRNIIFLGLALAGFWGTYFATAQLLDTYLIKERGFSSVISGYVSSLILFTGIIGGPLGGHLLDRFGRGKLLLTLMAIFSALIISTIPFQSQYEIVISIILLGLFAVGIFSILYAIPSLYKEIPDNMIPLSIGLINSIQISVGSIAPFAFTFISDKFSYFAGWFFLGVFVIIFLPLLLLIKTREAYRNV